MADCAGTILSIIEGCSRKQCAGLIDTLLSVIGLKFLGRIDDWVAPSPYVVVGSRKANTEFKKSSKRTTLTLCCVVKVLILFMGVMWA